MRNHFPEAVEFEELAKVTYQSGTNLFSGVQYQKLPKKHRWHLWVELILTVTMGAGGGLPNLDALWGLISSLEIKIPTQIKTESMTGLQYLEYLRGFGVLGKDFFMAFPEQTTPPSAEGAVTVAMYVPIFVPDPHAKGYEKTGLYHGMLKGMELDFNTVSNVTTADSNIASVTGTAAVLAAGLPADRMVLHPFVEIERMTNLAQMHDFLDADAYIRSLFAYASSGFSGTERDKVKIDGREVIAGEETNRDYYRRRLLYKQQVIQPETPGEDVGSIEGVNNLARGINYQDIIRYVDNKNNIGDSLDPKSSLTIAPPSGETRVVYQTKYHYWRNAHLKKVGKSVSADIAATGGKELSLVDGFGKAWGGDSSNSIYPLSTNVAP